MAYDLVLTRARVVTPWDSFDADIGIKDGKISALGVLRPIRSANVIDCRGLSVLPGIIDSHVHVRYPADSGREDFETATRAAAAGGITTVLVMPDSMPAVQSGESLRERASSYASHACVDFALYGGAGTHSAGQIQDMASTGAVGFKTLLCAPPAYGDVNLAWLLCTDEGSLLDLMKTIARTGLPAGVHAENGSICDSLARQLQLLGRVSPLAHAESRPEIAELVSTASTLAIAEETGVRLHLCHLSTDRAVRLAHTYRQRGISVTVETCPHYLTADVTDLERVGPFAVTTPPLRSPETVEALWKCVSLGMVDMVGSDHTPYGLDEKLQGSGNIFEAPSGVPGLETMLPLMLNEVAAGRLSIEMLVRLMSYNPARIFGLYPQKGAIMPGSDADLTIVDLKVRKTVQKGKMHSRAKDTALLYDGRSLTGWPVATIVRGQVIMRDGQITGRPGMGVFITPRQSGR